MTSPDVMQNARDYADRILKLIEPIQGLEDHKAILFLAYMNGFREGLEYGGKTYSKVVGHD